MTQRTPDLSRDEVVELRIHGVGGTTPQDLLSFPGDEAYPPPTHIAGDHIAGFFRRPWPAGKRRALEGYSWGGLTSRKGSRALWLLLLPFSIINAAGWLVEPRRDDTTHPTAPPRRPDTSKVARGARLQWTLIRAAALGITFVFVAWIAALSVDLVAYQCGGQAACTEGRWWMSPFTMDLVQDYPARRMILGALVPLALILLVVVLSYRSRNRYEAYAPVDPEDEAGHSTARDEFGSDGSGLADSAFWRSGDFVRRATYAHIGIAIASVGGLYALAVVQMTSGGSEESQPFAILFGIFMLFVVGGLVMSGRPLEATVEGAHPEWHLLWLIPAALTIASFFAGWTDGPEAAIDPGAFEPVFARAPLYGSLIVVAAAALMLVVRFVRWWRDPAKDRFLRLGITVPWALLLAGMVWWHRIPVLQSASTVVVASLAAAGVALIAWLTARHRPWRVGVFAIVALAAAMVVLGRASEQRSLQWIAVALVAGALLPTLSAQLGRQDRWRWAGPVAGTALALATLMVTVAGSITRLADFLDRGEEPGAPVIGTLETYGVMALFLMAGLVVVVLAAGIHFIRIRLDLWGPLRSDIAAEYDDEPRPTPGDEYEDCLDAAGRGPVPTQAVLWRSISTAARDIDVFLTFFALIPLFGVLFALARITLDAGTSGSALLDAIEHPSIDAEWSWLITGATWLASLAPLAGVLVVRAALSNDAVRRTVGIAWDILTFWPRRFHPLGPPAYSERAVPELARRMKQLSRHDDARVMLTAHSQGSVIATASLASLAGAGERLDKVAVITHGNPTGRLYRRFFPGYFGSGILRWLRAELVDNDGWLNAHRLTDPIGDAIFTGPDEDLAPPVRDRISGDVVLCDPPSRWRFSLDPCPTAQTHSHYLEQDEMVTAMDTIAGKLQPPHHDEGAADPTQV